MATNKYYVGDVGTLVIVDTLVDITAATVLRLIVQKPDGAVVVWDGVLRGTTSIAYTIGAGDFNAKGMYQLQAYVETAEGHRRGDVARFDVSAPFE